MFRRIMHYILTGGHPYKMSSRREVYEEIAEKVGVSPDKVYRIAHDSLFASIYDGEIVTELMIRGILVRQ